MIKFLLPIVFITLSCSALDNLKFNYTTSANISYNSDTISEDTASSVAHATPVVFEINETVNNSNLAILISVIAIIIISLLTLIYLKLSNHTNTKT